MTQFVLDQLAAAGLSVIQRDGRLFLEPNDLLTNELLQLAREHKHDLLAHLASAEVESNNNVSNRQTSSVSPPAWGADGWPSDTVPQPPPCPKCGSLDAWQAMAGASVAGPGGVMRNELPNWRCQRCDPPRHSSNIKAMAKDRREAAARFHAAAERRKSAAGHGGNGNQP
jgi:hypothetical protein